MNNLNVKLDEFREAFRQAVLNKELAFKVTEEEDKSSSYIATMDFMVTIGVSRFKVSMAVADDFICYHNDLLWGVFSKDDIRQLHKIIDEALAVDADKRKRIKELEAELSELKAQL